MVVVLLTEMSLPLQSNKNDFKRRRFDKSNKWGLCGKWKLNDKMIKHAQCL